MDSMIEWWKGIDLSTELEWKEWTSWSKKANDMNVERKMEHNLDKEDDEEKDVRGSDSKRILILCI